MDEPKQSGSSKKYCMVPLCKNTTYTTPDKIFFSVPKNDAIRKKWCKAMRRDEKKNVKLSSISTIYCCEDHFDVSSYIYVYYLTYMKFECTGLFIIF